MAVDGGFDARGGRSPDHNSHRRRTRRPRRFIRLFVISLVISSPLGLIIYLLSVLDLLPFEDGIFKVLAPLLLAIFLSVHYGPELLDWLVSILRGIADFLKSFGREVELTKRSSKSISNRAKIRLLFYALIAVILVAAVATAAPTLVGIVKQYIYPPAPQFLTPKQDDDVFRDKQLLWTHSASLDSGDLTPRTQANDLLSPAPQVPYPPNADSREPELEVGRDVPLPRSRPHRRLGLSTHKSADKRWEIPCIVINPNLSLESDYCDLRRRRHTRQ